MNQQYKQLNAGDIRQKGDEVRHITGCTNKGAQESTKFRSINLIGHPIEQSDLIVAEFRRPV